MNNPPGGRRNETAARNGRQVGRPRDQPRRYDISLLIEEIKAGLDRKPAKAPPLRTLREILLALETMQEKQGLPDRDLASELDELRARVNALTK